MAPSVTETEHAQISTVPKVAPKIIDLINAREGTNKPFVSIEFFPPRTKEGVSNLHARMGRMLENSSPLFTDMTWGAGGSTAELTLDLTKHMHETGHVANMHLTCTNMAGENGDPIAKVREALTVCKDLGVLNIVALRGDPPNGEETWTATEGGFSCALDLVKFMRKEFGQTFGISVAGYPEGHPNAITVLKEGEEANMTPSEKKRCSVIDGVTAVCKDADYIKEMEYLKEKFDAGADMILTQMFFDTDVFIQFMADCEAFGITCPIIPGLMCINAYGGFKKMTQFCRTRVPVELSEKMESIKDSSSAIKEFGVQYGIESCQKLIDGGVKGLHFYTLNLERVVYGITDGLGLTNILTEEGAKSMDKDAKSMIAVGSAWARVGDVVKCNDGEGIVKEALKDGSVVITLKEKQTEITLAKGSFEKVVFG
eukprot:CAMPEP_0194378370 /NCGR_PEP_ID=MMETSP0174-20130528/34798_1 /TAXON_ID=216777 /ORGANISM="Proboscia alata, Strain PI-D3" /LENGTH=426 /DNA_ID=CAMNT_0039160307 /DNA_START=44 /DNA_END=1324 /DNA_ORIENTATION=+